MEQLQTEKIVKKLRSRSHACFLVKYGLKNAFRPINCDLYAYAANNPLRYIDPDGNQSIPSLLDFLNLTSDPHVKIYNDMKASDAGDKHATDRLKYVFHEAGREALKKASSTMSDMSVISLCIGFPEGTAVFGAVSTTCDFLLVIDDFISGDKSKGVQDGIILVAGIAFSMGSEQGAKYISKSINIKIGKNGKYYELGTRGAIKSKDAIKKLITKDIASGYFGSVVVPNAEQIAEEAMKVYKTLTDESNDK